MPQRVAFRAVNKQSLCQSATAATEKGGQADTADPVRSRRQSPSDPADLQ